VHVLYLKFGVLECWGVREKRVERASIRRAQRSSGVRRSTQSTVLPSERETAHGVNRAAAEDVVTNQEPSFHTKPGATLMKTVTIIGAGSVGVACADAILHRQVCQRVSLLDVDGAKAEGEALDFAHVAPMLGHCQVDGGGMDRLESGADVCVITAGAKQRPSESRLQLVDRNLESLHSIATHVEARGLPRVALVVTNPVDVMTFALMKRWQSKGVVVLGTGTLLDSMRLRATLARHLEVSGESVHT
jgi:hypothetical protein